MILYFNGLSFKSGFFGQCKNDNKMMVIIKTRPIKILIRSNCIFFSLSASKETHYNDNLVIIDSVRPLIKIHFNSSILYSDSYTECISNLSLYFLSSSDVC